MAKLATLDALNEIAAKYKSTLSSSVTEDENSIDAISKKYVINDDSADDVSNLCKFLNYCVIKDSKYINDNEIAYSTEFADIMKSYATSKVSNAQLVKMLSIIKDYNAAIKAKYDIFGLSQGASYQAIGAMYANIITDIFGMDASSSFLTITSGSYAEELYDKIAEKAAANNCDVNTVYNQQTMRVMVFIYLISGLDQLSLANNKILNSTTAYITLLGYGIVGWNTSTPATVGTLIKTEDAAITVKSMKDHSGIERNVLIKTSSTNTQSIQKNTYYCGYSYSNPLILDEHDKPTKSIYLFYNKIQDIIIEKAPKYLCFPNNDDSYLTDDKHKIDQSDSVFEAKTTNFQTTGIYKVLFESTNNTAGITNYAPDKTDDNDTYGYFIDIAAFISNFNKTVSQNDGYNIGFYSTIDDKYSVSPMPLSNLTPTNYIITTSPIMSETATPKNNLYEYVLDLTLTSVGTMYSALINKILISFQFPTLSAVTIPAQIDKYTGTDMTSIQYYLSKFEKRSADDVETYFFQKKENVICIDLENLVIPSTDTDTITAINAFIKDYAVSDSTVKGTADANTINLDSVFSKVASDTTNGFQQDYYRFGIRVLYKEFNPIYRIITCADAKDLLCSGLANSGFTLNRNLYQKVHTILTSSSEDSNTAYLTSTQLQTLRNLKTNDLVCRESNDSDIIAYLSGDLLNYGTSVEQQDDINNFLIIYKKVRDYYYKVLLNRSFMFETGYKIYERTLIAAAAIDKFITSRISSTKSIDDYTTKDCDNFLSSFGMKSLVTQINDESFVNSILYKRRIIAKYNDLMSKKGSRAVLSTLFGIFNYKDVDIQIFKYLMFDAYSYNSTDSTMTTDVNVIAIPYDTTNTNYYLKDTQNTPRSTYSSFIGTSDNPKDSTWNIADVPEKTVKKYVTTPQATKYLGIFASKNIHDDFVQAKYALSAIRYLSDNFVWKTTDNTDTTTPPTVYSINNIDQIKYTSSTIKLLNSKSYTIRQLFDACTLLFSVYTMVAQAYYYTNGTAATIELNAALASVSNTSAKTFLGINSESKISDFTSSSSSSLSLKRFANMFSCTPFVMPTTYNDSVAVKSRAVSNTDTTMPFFTWKTGTLTEPSSGNHTNALAKELCQNYNQNWISTASSLNNYPTWLIPLSTVSANGINIDPSYSSFIDDLTEIGINGTANSNDDYDKYELSAKDVIENAARSINYINLLNTIKTDTDDTIKSKKLQAAYYYTKEAILGNPKYVLSDLSELFKSYKDTTYKFSIESAYTNIIYDMIDFPSKYLKGEYRMINGVYETKDVRDILDTVFNKFFTVTYGASAANDINATVPYFATYDNDTDNVKEILNKYSSIIGIDQTDQMYDYILGDVTSKDLTAYRNASDLTLSWFDKVNNKSKDQIKAVFDTVYEKLQALLSDTLTFTENVEEMQPSFGISQSVSNFFDFVKSSVKYFISYTTSLYNSNLKLSYDTKFESVPYAYSITDIVSKTQIDNFYYDEQVTITEETSAGGQ